MPAFNKTVQMEMQIRQADLDSEIPAEPFLKGKINSNGQTVDSSRNHRFLILSTSLLFDRILLHTNVVNKLKQFGEVKIWASSAGANNNDPWSGFGTEVEAFPSVGAFKEIPYNYLKRLNEFVWDFRLKPPSRLSMDRHVRSKRQQWSVRALKPFAYLLAACRSESLIEAKLESLLLSAPVRSVDGITRLLEYQPTVIVSSGLFQFEQPAIFEAARKLGIRTLAYIPSWDNVSTKGRMVYRYDGYIVWTEQIKRELHEFYPATRDTPIFIVGAPQFDMFSNERLFETRKDFCQRFGLDADRPIILYAIGSPNFIQEHHGAIAFAAKVARGELGDVQLLIRPHPIHDNAELKAIFDDYGPNIRLQETPNAGLRLTARTQDSAQVKDWINTFRHSDVVINLSSTVTVDAAIFDKPVINLDFDPDPSGAYQELVRDINHKWSHFKPIAESGGVWCVNDFNELSHAVRVYLDNPELHSKGREWITRYVCGFLDGKCGDRMAVAVADFAELQPHN
jgi:hypothetical protein